VGVSFYVSPDGDDQNVGSSRAPFRTLERARDAIRAMRHGGTPAHGGITVNIRPGVYLRDRSFELTCEDSGLDVGPVEYRACGDGPVRIVAGKPVDAVAFSRVTNPSFLARIPEAAHGQVVELDLAALGVTHTHRYPDVFSDGGGLVELFFNNQRMPLARYPNEGFMSMKRVVRNDGGTSTGKPGGVFEFGDPRHNRWKDAVRRGLWLRGYWRVPWQNEAVRVAEIDSEASTVTHTCSVPNGIGSKYHRPHGSGQEPYYALNLLEELDSPGEWCVDFETKKLFFWPPSDLSDGTILVSDMDAPVLSLRDTSNVVIRGLVLEGGLGHGAEIFGGRGVEIAECVVRNMGKSGIRIYGGSDHRVSGCELHALGSCGIFVEGGDRRSLTPARHSVVHNHIHHFAEIDKVWAAGIQVGQPMSGGSGGVERAVGMYVAHNVIHDAPHAGILYGGNDNLFEYNEIHDVCLLSNDMGGFYSRYDWASRGNIVRYNYIHHSPNAHGVYLDDGDSGDTIYGNVMYQVDSGVFLGGGHDNIVRNNAIVSSERGIHLDARGAARGYDATNPALVGMLAAVDYQNPPWSERYPEMHDLLQFHPELPTGNRIEGNVVLNSHALLDLQGTPDQLEFSVFCDNVEIRAQLSESPSLEEICHSVERELAKDGLLPGFEPFPLDVMSRSE
jgi:hypothetical protein